MLQLQMLTSEISFVIHRLTKIIVKSCNSDTVIYVTVANADMGSCMESLKYHLYVCHRLAKFELYRMIRTTYNFELL